MLRDERNLIVSTDSPEAVTRLDRAVEHFLKFHADTGSLLNSAITADPGFALALTFRGYLLLAAANPANRDAIARTLAAAEAASATASQRERWHVAAFAAWARDAVDESFRIWRRLLDNYPTDLMAVRICDTIWFRHGQTDAIREQADRLAPAWNDGIAGNDCFQSVWAFAHEETGDYAVAERAIDAALAQDRTNFMAHHVKAHVLEMDCRPQEGKDWLAAQAGIWSIGNNLVHHLWWHRALMRLDLGENEGVLADYDAHIRNFDAPLTKAIPDFYVDLQNAAALLWRLEQVGLHVGDRWAELADKAEARSGEAAHLLLVPHLMLALAATGRAGAADRYLAGLREAAGNRALWTAPAIADVVIPVCEAVLAHRRGDHSGVVKWLEPRQAGIRLLGGSNAQRDMFTQMLLDSAMRAGRRDLVAAMIAHETATRVVPPVQRAGYAAAARWLG
jgi:tetratricopeptide (TPR) repeat protein